MVNIFELFKGNSPEFNPGDYKGWGVVMVNFRTIYAASVSQNELERQEANRILSRANILKDAGIPVHFMDSDEPELAKLFSRGMPVTDANRSMLLDKARMNNLLSKNGYKVGGSYPPDFASSLIASGSPYITTLRVEADPALSFNGPASPNVYSNS